MATNCRTRRVSRVPADPYAVYDKLPPAVRAALQEGPQEWDASAARSRLRRLCKIMPEADAIARVVRLISHWHQIDIEEARQWQPKPGLRRQDLRLPSPHQIAGATMQTSGRGAY